MIMNPLASSLRFNAQITEYPARQTGWVDGRIASVDQNQLRPNSTSGRGFFRNNVGRN